MKEVSKNLKCLVMRNGIEIWKESERLTELTMTLTQGKKIGFIKVDDEMINSVDIVGIFTADTMDEMTRRKNGQFKCNYGNWHERKEKCECIGQEEILKKEEYREEHYKERGFYPL